MATPQSRPCVIKPFTVKNSPEAVVVPLQRMWRENIKNFTLEQLEEWHGSRDDALAAAVHMAGLYGQLKKIPRLVSEGNVLTDVYAYPVYECVADDAGKLIPDKAPLYVVMNGLDTPRLLEVQNAAWMTEQRRVADVSGADYARLQFGLSMRHAQASSFELLEHVDGDAEMFEKGFSEQLSGWLPWARSVRGQFMTSMDVGSVELTNVLALYFPDGSKLAVNDKGIHSPSLTRRDERGMFISYEAGLAC